MLSGGLLLSYVFLGLSLAAPIGPVNSAQIDKGIKNGFLHAWIVGAGAVTADGIFMAIVYLGFTHFINIPIIQVFLWLFGAFVLIYTGIESITSGKKLTINQTRNKDSLLSCYLTGFFMSITNPLSIMFWIGIYGSVLAKVATNYGHIETIICTSMIFLGLTLWDVIMAILSSGSRKFLHTNFLKIISYLSGISMIAFGIYFGSQGVKALVF
ncbi:amino acid transporter [Heyndrickxia shackletonii]|uniref:Amino acid transporter n=1 Tax=Heyndrickxia shackletonii TaxID=157838 RepID=A0A0Q3WWC9_9BACI|nr:LysE family transporter [Heyndrickxia shackletonii]KQL53037.1 amino acid transporter [Heyndrickxia shackletonii]NEY98590.1 LysE family transporter [Heyndrickxia shackletonii]